MAIGIYSFYRHLQPIFRRRRWQLFLDTFRPTDTTTILDIGGNVYDWTHLPIQSRITILNVAPTDSSPSYPERFTYVQGDGRAMPFADQSFDIVYCNSVIEHLYTYEDQARLAREVTRVGRGVFVQTPCRWFPVEPHFLTLFLHYLPKNLQRYVLPRFSFRGLIRSGDDMNIQQMFDELRLLTPGEMRRMFAGCEIHRERFLGLTKSIIALRKAGMTKETAMAQSSSRTLT